MADLSYIQATQEVKVVGQDSSGNNANYVGADANGNLTVKDYADGVTGSTIPPNTTQVGGTDGTNLRTLATDTSGNIKSIGNVASGTTDSGNPVKIGAVFNSTLPTPSNGQRIDSQADLNGRLLVATSPLDSYKATYSAAIANVSSAATATDIFTLTGSATKTIRVTRLSVNGTQTTAGNIIVQLIKRSSANSGGTSSSVTAVPHDSNDSSATGTVLAYTANPTSLGTSVGNVRVDRIFVTTTASNNSSDLVEYHFGDGPDKCIILRGTSQVLAINLNSTTITGGSFDFYVTWTEE